MKVSGEANVRGDVEQVYAALNDPGMLVRTIPGCQRLEQVGEATYKASVLAGVASVKGTFNGDVRLADQVAPHSFTLHASGAGAPGTVVAVARVSLSPGADGFTLVRYDADATIGGVIGGVGQRMIIGVARRNAADFFANIDRELAQPAPGPAPSGPRSAGSAATRATREDGALEAQGHARAERAPVSSEARERARAERAPADSERAPTSSVWTAPTFPVEQGRQRVRELVLAATFGAVIALLGVIVGAIVAG